MGKPSKARPIITLRGDSSGPEYYPRLLDRDCLRQKAVRIRSSTRWIDTYKTPNGGLNVPFIDKLGKFTGFHCYKWSCEPQSLIATVVSTISKRIMEYAHRHNKAHIVMQNRQRLVDAAAYYAFTKNVYFWNRVLFFVRNLKENGNLIHKLRLFFSSKWDDNKRFVYGHVTFQTKWLLLRALVPRDKSFFMKGGGGHRFTPESAPSRVSITNCVREIAYAISLI